MNYKITLQYDGTRYDGWQKQGNSHNTIQEKLETILGKMCQTPIEVHGSGRTDAGVHALAQTANFHLEPGYDAADIMSCLNRYLPADIAVTDICEVPERFHSRLNAVRKTYRYRIHAGAVKNVFGRNYIYSIEEMPDAELMRQAAAHLVGAQASAMQAAASNTAAGPAMAFMGMNQAAAAGGVNARDLYQMGGQQTAAQPQAAPAAGWTCSCGHTGNTGKFCAECGRPRPEAPAVWVCSCGAKNSGKFCSECGRPRPAAKCANCGFVPADPANPPKFCPECGKPFGA